MKVYVILRERGRTEGVVEHHRPPEPHVPGDPRDARRPQRVRLVIGPLGAPHTAPGLRHVQTTRRGTPQALLGGEFREVELRQGPRRIELAQQRGSRIGQ